MTAQPAFAKKIKEEISTRTTELRRQRMLRDQLFRWFFIPAVALCALNIVWLLIYTRPKDFVVPLQYSSLQGFDALGPWYHVLIYGLFSIVVTVSNLLLAGFSFEKSRIASFFLVIGTVIINLITLRVIITLAAQLNV